MNATIPSQRLGLAVGLMSVKSITYSIVCVRNVLRQHLLEYILPLSYQISRKTNFNIAELSQIKWVKFWEMPLFIDCI